MKVLYRICPLALAIVTGPTLAQADETAQMQQQIVVLQQQVNKLSQDRINLNGFFSTGYIRSNNDAGYAGSTTSSEVYDLSVMALQSTFSLSDQVQATMQIIGRGSESWEPEMEWAYLSYRPTSELQLRAGKMRQPLFMYSDFLEVGYAQPWARAPQTVYGNSPSSYVGADAAYTINLENSSITTQLFGGNMEDKKGSASVDVRNSFGLSTSWTNYVWTLRGVISSGELNLVATNAGLPPVEEERSSYLGVGVSYDDGNWQIISEATRTEIDGFYPDVDSAYLSVGHRFGAFTPYAVIGWTESQDNEERPAMLGSFLNTERTEYSVGVRWDITSGVALKADWTYATGFEDGPNGLDQQAVLVEGIEDTNVYTFKIDAAF